MKRSDIFLLNIILLFLTFSLAGLAIFHIVEDHEEPSYFKHMKSNWKQEPILELVKVDVDQSCATGFTNFGSFVWPGSIEACGCGNQLYPYECRATQILKGCEPIQEVSAQVLPNWQLGNSPFKLCKKTLTGFNFYDKFDKFTSTCDSTTEKLCHNKSYPICVPLASECPLNSISLGTITPNYFHNQTIVINSDWIYYMAREDEAYSYLADVRIEEGAGVCKELDTPNLSKGRENYILLRDTRSYCRELDTRFKQIGQVNEVDFFSVNGLLSKIADLLGYKIDESYIYGLYVRNVIPWQASCRLDILTDVKNLDQYFDDSHQLRIFEIVWLVIVFAVYLVWIIIDIIHGKTSAPDELLPQQLQLRLDRRNIKIFGFLVFTVQQFLCFIYHVNLFSKLQNMSQSSCSDAVTNAQINSTFTDYKNWTFSAYLTQFIFYIILIIIEFTVYFKIKKIADQNLLQALIKAKQAMKNKTPLDDEDPKQTPDVLPIIEEELEKEPSEKGLQIVEFQMKRNVDKTKAKNPKVKKQPIETKGNQLTNSNLINNNENSLHVNNIDTDNEIQLLSSNNLNPNNNLIIQNNLTTANKKNSGNQMNPTDNPLGSKIIIENANSTKPPDNKLQKQESTPQQSVMVSNKSNANANNNPNSNANSNNKKDTNNKVLDLDMSINDLDIEQEANQKSNLPSSIPQSLKPNNRQSSNNQLLVSKNEVTSRQDLADDQDEDDQEEEEQNKKQKKVVKKKKRVR